MKKTLFITSTILILALAGFVAWATTAGKGESEDFDQMLADGLLELRIKASILQELGWDAMSIDVAADSGEVTLSGKVEKETTKEMAKQVARALDGVSAVDNRVKVEKDAADSGTPVGDAVGDAESEVKDALLEARVKTRLLGELGRHGFKINVEVTDGVVSLRGDVADGHRREIALDTARGVKGVDRVIDLLKVKSA